MLLNRGTYALLGRAQPPVLKAVLVNFGGRQGITGSQVFLKKQWLTVAVSATTSAVEETSCTIAQTTGSLRWRSLIHRKEFTGKLGRADGVCSYSMNYSSRWFDQGLQINKVSQRRGK